MLLAKCRKPGATGKITDLSIYLSYLLKEKQIGPMIVDVDKGAVIIQCH